MVLEERGKFRAFAYVSTKRAIARFAEMAKRKCARKRSYLDAGTYKNEETLECRITFPYYLLQIPTENDNANKAGSALSSALSKNTPSFRFVPLIASRESADG